MDKRTNEMDKLNVAEYTVLQDLLLLYPFKKRLHPIFTDDDFFW